MFIVREAKHKQQQEKLQSELLNTMQTTCIIVFETMSVIVYF